MQVIILGVNLPRWGLKLYQAPRIFKLNTRVNLPRWGLKRSFLDVVGVRVLLCKFTPLGFETL